MTYPTRRQFAPLTQASLSSLAKTYTLSQAALAGNLLVITYAGDKNTGTLTVTDNVGNNGGANPWTVEVSVPGASVSTYIAWKVAVGGETTITATVQTAPSVGSTGYAEEMVDDGSGAWMVVAKAVPGYDDTPGRTSTTSGTTDTADHDGRALAVGTIDSMSSIGTEAQRTLPSFTNFTKIYDPDWPASSGGGSGGCYVGSANLAKNATTSTTFATNGGGDQLYTAIVAFGRVESAANPPNVSAPADTSVVSGQQVTLTGTNTGGAITTHAWTLQAGPGVTPGTPVGSAAQINWTGPATTGAYTLRYTGSNADGSDFDDVVVTVTAAAGGDIAVRGRLAPTMLTEANQHTLSTPPETQPGDSIFIWTSTDEVDETTTPAGAVPVIGGSSTGPTSGWATDPAWTAEQSTTTNVRGTLFYKASAQGGGADQLIINFPPGVAEPCAYIAISVASADTPVVSAITAAGNATQHTPAGISGLDSAKTYISLLFVAIDAKSTMHDVTTPYPTGYPQANIREAEPAALADNQVMAVSLDGEFSGVTSITPGPVHWTTTDQSIAIHVAIPESSGPPPVDNDPTDIVPISRTAGYPHYAFDIADRGASSRVLYPPSQIENGALEFDPEFMGTSDGWLQTAVYEDAPTTSGSTNPRSEGRETQPGSDSNLAWDHLDGGTHWQRFRARVMQHPAIDNVGISVGQVHSLDDDIMMIRTRMEGTTQNTLILREYDPNTANSVDLLTLNANYQFQNEFDVLFLWRGGRAYVFYNDFLIPVHSREPSRYPATGTYMFKWGCYIQNTTAWPADSLGIVQFRNVQHWHTGWAAPINYFNAPVVNPGAAVASHPSGSALTRTATESDPSGAGIIERKWSILSGPAGVGTAIGTSATLNWTPTTQGTYELMYGARNAAGGWSDPTFLSVTVTASVGSPPGRMLLAVS